MILYHASNVYQILSAIEHRILYHKNDHCVLIMPKGVYLKIPHYHELHDLGFFNEIFLFDRFVSGEFPSNIGAVIEMINERYKKAVPYDINEFSNFYIWSVHTMFPLMLVLNNIPFIAFEDGLGALSRPEILIELHKKTEKGFDLLHRSGLYTYSNPLITKKYCNMKTQKEGFYDPLAEHFDVVENLAFLSEEELGNVKKFFRCPSNIPVPDKTAIIFTQQFAALLQLSFEQHVTIYQILADYFLDGYDLLFKLHPDDYMYYRKLFPGCEMISEPFPAELFLTIFDKLPDTISSISSTSTHLIRDAFERKILFTANYEKTFEFTHKYYAALRLAKIFENLELAELGTDENLVANLLEFGDIGKFSDRDFIGKLLLLDNVRMDMPLSRDETLTAIYALGENDAAIFINSAQDYLFYEYGETEVFDNLIPVIIKKETVRQEDNYTNPDDETIYFYSKNNQYRKTAEHFTFTKELFYTGIKIFTDETPAIQTRIKIAEAELAAANKMLLYYIDKEKQLKTQIDELKQAERNID